MPLEDQIETRGVWNYSEVRGYLEKTKFPLRLATMTTKKYPLVTSLWFIPGDNGTLWCAVQRDSDVASNIQGDQRCGFEVGPNDIPYFGVRGQGRASLIPAEGEGILKTLIHRYLGETNKELSKWLLKRSSSETAICIYPAWYFSWDYRDRME